MLPGGVWRDGKRHRGYRFRPANGTMELAVGEAWSGASSVPAAVTAALEAALEEVGEGAADAGTIRDLAVGDRQYLVRRLAAHLGTDRVWLSATCANCEVRFDFLVEQAILPSKVPQTGPGQVVLTSQGRVVVRGPTGADQEAVLVESDDDSAALMLLSRCIEQRSTPFVFAELRDEDITRLEEAIESVSPEVTTMVTAECPDCGESNKISVDPYLGLDMSNTDLFDDIHTMANAYHWSEAEILELPLHRRRRYLDLISHGIRS